MNEDFFDLFFNEERKGVREHKCPFCSSLIDENDFVDELSYKEFKISGLCQNCQDKVFGIALPLPKKAKKEVMKKLSAKQAAKILEIDLDKVISDSVYGDFSDLHIKIDLWERHPSKISGNTVYFLPANVDDYVKGANVLSQVNLTNRIKSDGYGGSTWKLKCTDGNEYEVQGPWSSNCDSLKMHTGIDLTSKHKFYFIIAEKSMFDIISNDRTTRFLSTDQEYILRTRAANVIWEKRHYSFNAYNLIEKFEWRGSWDDREWEVAKRVIKHNKPLYYTIKSSGGSTTFVMTIEDALILRNKRAEIQNKNFGL